MLKKLLGLIVIMMMAFSLAACGVSDEEHEILTSPVPPEEDEPVAEEDAASDSLAGMYLLSSVDFQGDTMAYADLVSFGMADGSYLQLNDDGSGIFGLAGEAAENISYDSATMEVTDATGETITMTKEGDTIILNLPDASSFSFTLEGSAEWPAIEAIEGTLSGLEDLAADTIAATGLTVGTKWYGSLEIWNSRSDKYPDGIYDIWGRIEQGEEYPFFEIYASDDFDNDVPLLSYYIEFNQNGFAPLVTDDAWVFDRLMGDLDTLNMSGTYLLGAISFTHLYEYEEDLFNFTVYLREDGARWDEATETLPPGYDDYKARHGL